MIVFVTKVKVVPADEEISFVQLSRLDHPMYYLGLICSLNWFLVAIARFPWWRLPGMGVWLLTYESEFHMLNVMEGRILCEVY